jgi:hypothetical protein
MPTTLTQPALVVGTPRIIEDKGIYIFSEAERNAWRTRLLVTVLKKPDIIYESFKPNEPECYFGVYQVVDKGYIQSQGNLKFPFQEVFRNENHSAHRNVIEFFIQNQDALIATSIGNIILDGLGKPHLVPGVGGAFFKHLAIPSTEVWFKVVGGCKIAVVCEHLPLPLVDGDDGSSFEPEQDNNPSNAGGGSGGSGGGGGNPSNPPGTNPDSPSTPPYNPSNQDNNRTSSLNRAPGRWMVTINFQSHPAVTVDLNDTDGSATYSAGAKCFEGIIGNSSGDRNIDGLAMFKNGAYLGCVEDFSKSTVTSLEFHFVPT